MPPRSPPPPTTPAAAPISAFTSLKGGSTMAIAPGDRLVALHAQVATWWEQDLPIEAVLPTIPVDGARWVPGGQRLHVGLGTLDLAARSWRPEPSLEGWRQRPLPVSAVAWFGDDRHVAIVTGPPPQRVDRPTVTRTLELAVVSAADGAARGRLALEPGVTVKLAAAADRLLVLGATTLVVDLDAKVVAGPAGLPEAPSRGAFGAGMFAVTGHGGEVTLLRPSDGAVLGTWEPTTPSIDAVPVPHGVVAVDLHGTVRVGCLDNGKIRTVAEASAGSSGLFIQLVSDRLIVAGSGANPLRWATFTNPCR
jgi:hypothetical protein